MNADFLLTIKLKRLKKSQGNLFFSTLYRYGDGNIHLRFRVDEQDF